MHLSSNLKRLILYTVQSSTSRIEILQLVQSVLGWNILILCCLTYRHPVFKLPSDSSILYHRLRQRRFISFYFSLDCFPIWCCLGCDNSYTLSLLSCYFGKLFSSFLIPQTTNITRTNCFLSKAIARERVQKTTRFF